MLEHPVLTSVARHGIRLGLERLSRFLRVMGSPQANLPAVHVGGTNGKGSVTTMVAEILRQQGYKVGHYTSPHLQRVNERIRVNGSEVSDRTLSGLLDEIDSARREMSQDLPDMGEDGVPLTYFEVMTAAAFLHFARSKVDVAVLEVGMGGRLDATNLVNPLVSVIASVGLDHTEVLGPDLASIAGEKAGIIKPSRPVVVGAMAPDAARVIRAIASDLSAPLYMSGEHFHVVGDNRSFTWRGWGTVRQEMSVGLSGVHQVENASIALAAVDLLPVHLACDDLAVRAGLAQAMIPGRLEWLAPDILIDCAHNPDAALTLASYLRARPRRATRTLLLGCSREKDIRAIGAILAPHVDRVFTTACSHPRALAPGEVAQVLEGMPIPVMPAGRIEEALALARAKGGEVVVAGSCFLAGAVRDLLGVR